MGVRESKVERHLRSELKKIGGECLKWGASNEVGVPDQICFNPRFLCEVKTISGKLSSVQVRCHDRLRKLGETVTTVFGVTGVDKLIEDIKNGTKIKENYYASKR